MAMLRHAVGPHAFVTFDKEIIRFRFSTRPAYAAQAVGNDVSRLDQLFAQKRNEWQQNARGITTGTRYQAGAGNFLAINLRQAVDRVGQQVWGGVLVSVKFAVSRGVFDSKIRTQIDHAQSGLQERRRKFNRDAMRKREKRDVRSFANFFRRGLAESQIA